ncbi:MAG: efflux RND transporter permease subunit [Deltaproteobacteria bacterium]|nr:efflux RND transporter permease subunit [Deltaproteobacteria bacterium]
MIKHFIDACFRRPFLVVLCTALGVAAGADAFMDLRRDVFPDLSAPVFNVITQNPAMSAEELEIAIAIPVETALAGLPDVRRVRSTSQLGVAQVTVEFEPDADYFRARQLVAERLAEVGRALPPGTEPPLLSSLTGRLNEIFEITLEADAGTTDLMTLRDLAEHEVKNRLMAVPGVAAVERLGGYLRQVQVLVDPDRMSARQIALSEVLHALEGSNQNASGGFFVQGPMELSVRAVGRAETAEDIGGVVVALRAGTPILLRDIADVREGPAIRRGLAHRLAGEIVSCRISKQFGADTVQVAADVREALAGIERSLPKGVRLRVVYDQSTLVDESLSGVGRAIGIGAIFVVLVIVLLLGDLRAAVLVTLSMPLSLALAALLLRRVGVGLNTMTLGGLAIAVGILVDASIIMTENIVHRLAGRGGPERRAVAAAAAVEVARPILFATLIVIAVFLPLFAMTGIEGRMYSPLALAVTSSIAAALVLALSLTPVAAGLLLRPHASREAAITRRAKAAYARVLDRALARPRLTAALAAAVTVPVLALAPLLGTDFMPQLDEGALLIQTNLPAEASLDEVDRLNHRAEDVLRTFPEVEDVVRRTGRAERTEDPMPHTLSDVLVLLNPDRERTGEELEHAMRERLERVPGVSALFTTPLGMRIDEGLGGTPADLAVRIYGPDLETLAELADGARDALARVEGLTDLRAERVSGLPQVRIAVDRAALARAGLTPGDVIGTVRVALVGEEGAQLWKGERRYDVVVRLEDDHTGDVNALRGLLIDAHDGTRIPLGQLASIDVVDAPGAIRREAGSRRIAVEAAVEGRDLGSAAAEARAALSTLELPAGYFLEVGGRIEHQARAQRALLFAALLAVVLVIVLLVLALDSVRDAALILLSVPTAVVGGVIGVALSGESWNVSSLVGLIGLFGIAVQNGLVLMTQVKALRAEGRPFTDALREASVARVRPKLMTAGTAILGLLPLLVLRLPGTELERPLAVVMIGGLVSSTLFTLLVLPALYAVVERAAAQREPRATPAGSSGTPLRPEAEGPGPSAPRTTT